MNKNRFYKSTLGIKAEVVIAQSLDVSAGGAIAGTAATGTASVTVAATTTDGDQVVLTVGPHTFGYASVGAVTAANYGTALLAALNADTYFVANGITWTKSGTTSLVLTGTWPVGSQYNGIPLNFEAGSTNAGPSFSSFSSTNTAGGTGATGGGQSTYKGFIDSAIAGALGVFWDDTNLAVERGGTAVAANAARKFFYAWKQGDSVVMRTTAIPAGTRKYTSLPYTAGQADIMTVTVGGTVSVGQWIHVKVIDETFPQIPYPFYTYSGQVTVDVATTLTAIAAAITADTTNENTFNATSSSTVLTITGSLNRRFKTAAFIETTPAYPTDASAITMAYTQRSIAPLGTYADIKELENYFLVQNGAILYAGANGMTNVSDFQTQSSNVVSGTNYGQLIVTALKTEKGEVKDFTDKAYVIVALPTASLATLALY